MLAYSAVRAGINGLARELFAVAGAAAGFFLACWYYAEGARSLSGLISTPALADFAAFLLIFAAATVAGSLLGRLFRRGARTVGLGAADRLGGAAFGLLRGAALCTGTLLAFTVFLPSAPWLRSSRIAPYFLRGAHAISFTMPEALSSRLRGELDLLEGMTAPNHSFRGWIKSRVPSHTGVKPTL